MRRAATILAACAAALACAAPAFGQGAYSIPADNPFVGQANARGEVYAYGFRNPWRFTFDRANGDLLIPDVGGSEQEEINFVPNGQGRGANFGWSCREGLLPGPRSCGGTFFDPFLAYPTPDPGAVVGGYVVRAPDLPAFAGRFLYADFYTSSIQSVVPGSDTGAPTGAEVEMVSSFGESADGHLYAASLTDGGLYRIEPDGTNLKATTKIGDFTNPIHIAAPPGDSSRLFVVERAGRIQVLTGGQKIQFLDIDPQVVEGSEGGLLSMAFAPDYATSGRFYVCFTDGSRNIRIEEFQRSGSDPNKASPASQRQVLSIPHPGFSNHFGGQLQFGPDGLLYASTGDGGSQGDPPNNAQNLNSLLGKLLRIDPRAVGGPSAGPGGGGAGGGQLVMDSRAPTLRLRVARLQRILRTKAVIVYARTTEVGQIRATGRLVIGNASKSYKLRSARRNAIPGRRYKLRLKLTRRQLRIAARALRTKRRVRASIRLSAIDAAGNVRASRRSVRARR